MVSLTIFFPLSLIVSQNNKFAQLMVYSYPCQAGVFQGTAPRGDHVRSQAPIISTKSLVNYRYILSLRTRPSVYSSKLDT